MFEAVGRGAAGIVDFPTEGFALTGGFGLVATGGGAFEANELGGRELASELEGGTFQGVADPLLGAFPGKTETGFVVALAAEGVISTLGSGAFLGGGTVGGAGALCGTSSR